MKITIYTTTDCQFSKTEKEYLTSHQLPYEEKNLETNKEFLTEMLAVGNNFSGTPVTKIEKDDGASVVLKGFTKEEFDTALGFTPEMKKPEVNKTEPQATEVKPKEEPKTTTMPAQTVQPSSPITQPTQTPQADPALSSLIDKLENKTTPPPPPTAPNTSNLGTAASPSIPDFPGK